MEVAHRETNQHVVDIALDTHPNFRRRGLAKQLLHKVLELADLHKRSLIIGMTTDRIPAGDLVAEHLGASKGTEMHTHQLRLSELEAGLIETWLSVVNKHHESHPSLLPYYYECVEGRKNESGYELGCWEDEYPESGIEEIATLMEVMNTAPQENLQVEDEKITPDWLREKMTMFRSRDTHVWTLYLRHRASRELVGYTETFWNSEHPAVLWQAATGVVPAHRGHGLGKWLKAAMIQKVQTERPSVVSIRTNNADSNAAMLAINQKLGFRPFSKDTIWQLETKQLRDYLQAKS